MPGGTEAKGAGAADSYRDHPAVGGGRHQDPGLCALHEPGLSPESWLRGTTCPPTPDKRFKAMSQLIKFHVI